MSDFNYKDKSAPKLTDEFKRAFSVNIKGKDAIKLEGLTALAHEKGMWKMETELIQFPSDQNNWTAICKTTIGGYDWDPIEQKIVRVEYTDIGDANASNCGKMVAASYIRMASTRSQGRALRKYTNVDMVCSSEMDTVEEAPEPYISVDQLKSIQMMLQQKHVTQQEFMNMLQNLFNTTAYSSLTESQGKILIATLSTYVPANVQQAQVTQQ